LSCFLEGRKKEGVCVQRFRGDWKKNVPQVTKASFTKGAALDGGRDEEGVRQWMRLSRTGQKMGRFQWGKNPGGVNKKLEKKFKRSTIGEKKREVWLFRFWALRTGGGREEPGKPKGEFSGSEVRLLKSKGIAAEFSEEEMAGRKISSCPLKNTKRHRSDDKGKRGGQDFRKGAENKKDCRRKIALRASPRGKSKRLGGKEKKRKRRVCSGSQKLGGLLREGGRGIALQERDSTLVYLRGDRNSLGRVEYGAFFSPIRGNKGRRESTKRA